MKSATLSVVALAVAAPAPAQHFSRPEPPRRLLYAAPVLGLYARNDARINSTLRATEAAMKKAGKSYEIHTFEGAGRGFMVNQAGAGGANLKAAQDSWPLAGFDGR
jgi:carboxymethylenebutenolidase